ncbi:MAG TPA: tetratricopeptide repeat protein [Tepidisphaeraceae bacterium]|jgi:tetratricopeptide (TPR) repeat protein|nr:tetratricopeptide repeat protein [Tepidisphaeraceae bacterium]
MARRVNTQFLTILLLIVIAAAVAVGLIWKLRVHEYPDHYVALGQQAIKDHNWANAIDDFAKAASLGPKDPKLQVMLGQALAQTEQTDPTAQAQEVAAYQRALEIDPKFLPALMALSKLYTQAASGSPDTTLYQHAIDYTNRAQALSPDDENLASLPDRLVIQEWVSNLNIDQKNVDNAIKDLNAQWKKHPADSDLPWVIATAKVKEGARLAGDNPSQLRRKDVTDLYDAATATFESVLTGKDGGSQDHNAAMHYRFAEVLMMLASVNQSSPDVAKQDNDRAVAEISRARALVKEIDPQYMEINEFAANLALRHGDRAGAIAIYRKMPQDSPEVRLDLGDLLGRDPATRTQAVRLLKMGLASLQDDPTHVALYGMRFRLMLTLVNLQVMNYAPMHDSPEKTALHDEIQQAMSKLDQVASYRSILPLKEIEARFRLMSSPAEAMQEVQMLSKLMTSDASAAKDYYLQLLLAQGYEQTNQRADALGVLKNLAQQFQQAGTAVNKEMVIQVKKMLVELLLTEQPDQVQAQLDELEKLDPGDPALNLYHIQYLLADPDKNKDEIKRRYVKMDEDTPEMTSKKARVAVQIKDFGEAARLLNATVAKDPKDVTDFILLARVLYSEGKKDQAVDAANRGLAANPGQPQLQLLIPALKGESPKVLEDLQEELAKGNPDKVQGELMQAAMASGRGDSEAEELHLKAAEQLSPDSPHIQELLFDLYIRTKRYAEAGACIPKLAKADADQAGGAMFQLSLAEAQGDNAGAERIARELVQDKPEFSRSWLAMGDVLQKEGQFDQAIPQYLQCLQKQSNVVEAYVGLAQCYYALHRPDDALSTIKQGMDRMPGNQTLRELKLTHELNYGQPSEAVTEIEAELNARPDQPQLYAALAQVLLRYAAILDKNQQHSDALKQAQEAVDVLKKPLLRWPDESELYAAMAQAQLEAQHPVDGLKTLQQWASRDAWKKRPDPYVSLSNYYEMTGNHDKAEDALHTALAHSGYAVDLQIRMASMLALHHKYDDSLQLLRAVNSNKPAVREKIIEVLLISGKTDEADAELKADLATNPPDSELLRQVWTVSLFERGKYQKAVEEATEALAENPKDMTVLYARGRSRLRTQPPDPAGALQDLEILRQSSPNNVDVLMNMSQAHLMLHQPDDAVSELETALRASPMNKDVRLRLVDLYVNNPHPRVDEALRLLVEVEGTPPFDKDASIFEAEAVIYNRGHNNDLALSKSETALRLAPDDLNVVRTNMQILGDRQDYQGLVDHYAALKDKWKKTSWALWDLGMAEKQLNSPKALPDLKRALMAAVTEDDPEEIDQIAQAIGKAFGADEAINAIKEASKDHLSAKLTLAHLYQGNGDSASALATIDDIMAHFDKLSRRDQINTLTSAAILYQMAQPKPLVDRAYDAYQQWLKLDPNNLEAMNNLACLLADDYSPPRAKEGLEYANRAVNEMSQLGRTEPRLLDTQGWLTILNGSPIDGVQLLNTAMTQFAPFPDEYLHLGEGYLRMPIPDPVQAETQAKLGLQLIKKQNPDAQDATVRSKLQDLIDRSEEIRQGKQQAQVP